MVVPPEPHTEFKILSGEGVGEVGKLVGFQESAFGHVWYTLQLESGRKISVRDERCERVDTGSADVVSTEDEST